MSDFDSFDIQQERDDKKIREQWLRAEGAAAERAAIAAWLRNLRPSGAYDYSSTAIADMIERGEHAQTGEGNG